MVRPSTALLLCAFVAVGVARPAAARAADSIVWKFEAGQTLRYHSSQDTRVTVDLGPGGKETQQITNVIDLSRTVAEVKPDGAAVIRQKIDRMQLKIAPASGTRVEIDSQSTDEPQGFAAMIGPLFREITAGEATFTMTPHGKIADVAAPQSVLQALGAAPGAAYFGDLPTEGFLHVVAGVALELPDEIEPGVEWTTTTKRKTPELGEQTIKMTYRYDGPQEVDGVEFEAFAATIEVDYSGGPVQIEVADEQSSGRVLFDRNAGCLESLELEHRWDVKLTRDGKTVTQSMDQATHARRLAE